MKFTIQEYVVGTRYYIHYFYSPFATSGYTLSKGALEMLGVDRRDEANIDEMYKLGAQEALRKMGLLPTFVVRETCRSSCGNRSCRRHLRWGSGRWSDRSPCS